MSRDEAPDRGWSSPGHDWVAGSDEGRLPDGRLGLVHSGWVCLRCAKKEPGSRSDPPLGGECDPADRESLQELLAAHETMSS